MSLRRRGTKRTALWSAQALIGRTLTSSCRLISDYINVGADMITTKQLFDRPELSEVSQSGKDAYVELTSFAAAFGSTRRH